MKYGDINLKTIDGKVYMQSRAKIRYFRNTLEEDIEKVEISINNSQDGDEIKRLQFGLEKFKAMLDHMNKNIIDYVDIKEVALKKLVKIMKGECEVPIK